MDRALIVVGLVGLVLVAALLLRRRSGSARGPAHVDPAELGLGEPGVGVVEFASRYCESCRVWATALRDAEVPFTKIDVGERPELARRYGVRETPLVLAVRVPGGEVVAAHGGDPDREAVGSLRELAASSR
jgi:Thioredoxin